MRTVLQYQVGDTGLQYLDSDCPGDTGLQYPAGVGGVTGFQYRAGDAVIWATQ